MVNPTLPIVAIDFDGTIHSYEKGWQEGQIYGTPVPGFFNWCDKAKNYFRLVIYSSRSDSHKNIKPMVDWLVVHLWDWKMDHPDSILSMNSFEFPNHKPPALINIDDRAITFTGDWTDPKLDPVTLRDFRSWVNKEKTDE